MCSRYILAVTVGYHLSVWSRHKKPGRRYYVYLRIFIKTAQHFLNMSLAVYKLPDHIYLVVTLYMLILFSLIRIK